MSFREIRAFSEILRNLHHPNPPPFDAFRNPNPLLTIELLSFLLELYKPSVKLPDKYETTEHRVQYFRFVGEFVYKELRIELKLKDLYESKEGAVREILKIANEVYRAQKLSMINEVQAPLNPTDSTIIDNIRTIKRISSQITELGIKLYDLIEGENELKKERNQIFNQHQNVDYIRRDVEQSNKKNTGIVEETLQSIQELKEQEAELLAIKRRRENEYDRTRKRLEHLSQYKPAHLEELESRENEMQLLFDEFSQGCRNLEYLEYELQLYQDAEKKELQRNQSKIEAMRRKLYKHEQNQMFQINNSDDESGSDYSSDELDRRPAKVRVNAAPTSPSDSPERYGVGKGKTLQKAAFSEMQSSRPTSRRRPQSSNLYGTEKRMERKAFSESEDDDDDDDDDDESTQSDSNDDGSQITGSSHERSGSESGSDNSSEGGSEENSDMGSEDGSEYSDEDI